MYDKLLFVAGTHWGVQGASAVISMGDRIYAAAWADPSTVLVSARGRHLQSWDPAVQAVIATYTALDPISLHEPDPCFSLGMDRSPLEQRILVGGYGRRTVKMFDLEREGDAVSSWHVWNANARNPVLCVDVYARTIVTGTADGVVEVRDVHDPGRVGYSLDLKPHGITQVFVAMPHLYVSQRSTSHIWCYDMRQMAMPVAAFDRQMCLHKRVGFCVSDQAVITPVGEKAQTVAQFQLSNVARHTPLLHTNNRVTSCALSQDQQDLAVGVGQGIVHVPLM